MLYKVIRAIVNKADQFRSKILATYYSIIYPGCTIRGTYLSSGITIVCSDKSKLIIEKSFIGKGTSIIADHGAHLNIMETFVGQNCVIVAREFIIIESDCQIAEMVVIRDQNHRFGELGKAIKEQGFTTEPIHIGKNVWLGAKVSVMAGSVIEDNVVVGAHSLVRGRLQANRLFVGTPVRCIRCFTHPSFTSKGTRE
jgi:acetyltransferase-like isoleucine patch superfamily enzyme